MQKRRILIITHSYAPFQNPRSFRWRAVAECWTSRGDEVDVICAWAPGLLRQETSNGVEIYRAGGSVIERMRRLLIGTGSPLTMVDGKPVKSCEKAKVKPSLWYRLIRFVHDITWKYIYWPDYACLWYRPTVRKAVNLINQHHYDYMISVSYPYTGHLVGRKLKAMNPNIKWLVDTGDPFCFSKDAPPNNLKLYDHRNQRSESNVFEQADIISVTTELTRKYYLKLFPFANDKIEIIPPLVSIDLTNKPERGEPFLKGDCKKLLVVGTLYKKIRNPGFLLKLFDEILKTDIGNEIELHFMGAVNECRTFFEPYRDMVGKKIFLHGLCKRDDVVKAMSDADILVNISNRTSFQLPSKLVEYVWAGKPILNLSVNPKDSSSVFLNNYPAFLNLVVDKDRPTASQVQEVRDFIENPPETVPFEERQKWLAPFTTESIVSNYDRLLYTTSNSQPQPTGK